MRFGPRRRREGRRRLRRVRSGPVPDRQSRRWGRSVGEGRTGRKAGRGGSLATPTSAPTWGASDQSTVVPHAAHAGADAEVPFVRALVDVQRRVSADYVEPVDADALRLRAIEGLVGGLDPYSGYVPPADVDAFEQMLTGSFVGVGIQIERRPPGGIAGPATRPSTQPADVAAGEGEVVVVTPMPNSPAYKAGVRAGDVIEAVDGGPLAGLSLEEVTDRVKGPPGTRVTLTLRRPNGEVLDLAMPREQITMETVKGVRHEPGSDAWDYSVSADPPVALIRLTQFTPGSAAEVRRVIRQQLDAGTRGFVLDLRFNPGGNLDEAEALADALLEGGVIVRTRGRNRPERTSRASADGTLPPFPLAVLINETSASAAEVVAGALKDNGRAVVVGARSYGKGSVQEVMRLADGAGELKLTVAYYYLPSGRLVHRRPGADDWGVTPHLDVPMDEATQRAVVGAMLEAEVLRSDDAPVATQPAGATTRPVDAQLGAAVEAVGRMVETGATPAAVSDGAPSEPATRRAA